MNRYDEKIWILITKELSGEATSEERNELQQWLAEDSEHRKFYHGIKSSWKKSPRGSVDASFLFDYESGLGKLRSKLKEEDSILKKSRMMKKGSRTHAWKIAASIILLVTSLSVYLTAHYWEQPLSMTRYATSNIEQRIITLPDGSVVRLNKNSEIAFRENFAGETRKIQLQGEAFFDVARNPVRPFIIYVGDAVVRVLGTAFNVKEGGEVMVVVKEGVVSFRPANQTEKNAARLTAGQLGLLSPHSNEVKIEQTNIENYMSWMNGYLKFDSMPFGQVIRQLERIYGIECKLQDSSINSLQLTAYTERMQMEEVLKTIALAMDLAYKKQGNTITWMREREEVR